MSRPKKLPKNQFDGIKKWLDFYQENKKLPYNEIVCGKCKTYNAKLKGVGFKHAFEKAGKDIEKMLKTTLCKDCRSMIEPKEKKPLVKKIKTQQEIDDEIEEIRRNTPKIDFNKPRVPVFLKDNQEACEKHTTSCLRPDIYLNNDKTCDKCSIKKYCVCRLKRFQGEPRRK